MAMHSHGNMMWKQISPHNKPFCRLQKPSNPNTCTICYNNPNTCTICYSRQDTSSKLLPVLKGSKIIMQRRAAHVRVEQGAVGVGCIRLQQLISL